MYQFLIIISFLIPFHLFTQESLLDKSLKNLDSANTKLRNLSDKAKTQTLISNNEINEVKNTKITNPGYIQKAEVNNAQDGDYYTVELFYDRFPLDRSHNLYKVFPDLQESIVYETFRYTIGKFATEKLAIKFTENIKNKGFAGTVVKFEKGKRVMK